MGFAYVVENDVPCFVRHMAKEIFFLYLAGFQYFDCPVCRIGLLIFNWQMGLALLWVALISFAIVILSRKWQEKLSKKHMNARLELAEGIQECLETVQDIKACNQEEDYLHKLSPSRQNRQEKG